MRGWSLRGRLLLISILFAVLVVGGIALTTYVIVSDGMQVVAYDTTQRVASSAAAIVSETAREAEVRAHAAGLEGARADAAVYAALRETLPKLLSEAGLSSAGFALYSEQGRVIWASRKAALHPTQDEARARAVETGEPTRSVGRSSDLFRGLTNQARLATVVIHVPVPLPDGATGVLDVTYVPLVEEQVIDAIRVPMALLAVAAMLIMVVLMQTSMAWVLNLVDDLRRAADSIDAGRLDDRLPASSENEIGELANSLNRLLDRLQRRADAQGRFVADASHELATPVAGIRGYTSILRAWGAEDERVREEAIDAIDRESKRMARLTSDLLNLLHADQGLRLQSERFDLNHVARERLAATASRYLDDDIEFIGPEDESLVMVGDPDRVEDVMSILLDNAAKYTPRGGSVALMTNRKRDDVIFLVSDTGKGIPESDLPRIFDRFFRSDVARSGGESGFGLGLSIAKSMVDNMGGDISVDSTLGEGTTFTVRLPRGRV